MFNTKVALPGKLSPSSDGAREVKLDVHHSMSGEVTPANLMGSVVTTLAALAPGNELTLAPDNSSDQAMTKKMRGAKTAISVKMLAVRK